MLKLNLTVAIIQTLLCISAITAISLKSEDKNDLMISSRDLQVNNEITTYATYNSNVILGLLIAFTAVTAFFHYAYSFDWFGYESRIKNKNNSLRWIEYSITATIMIVVICFASGTVELNVQILVAVMIASSMLLGDIVEKTMGTQVAKIATFVGWLLVLGVWAIIIKNYEFAAKGFTVPECDKKITPPSFVAYLVIILVVFYISFGFVQLYQICRPKTDYKHIEKAYSVLSTFSKTALVSIMLWGILSRAQAIDPCAIESNENEKNNFQKNSCIKEMTETPDRIITTTVLNNIDYLDEPFPHCVVDNFLDNTIADELYDNIKSLKLKNANSSFTQKSRLQYNKFGFEKIGSFSSPLKDVFVYLTSKEFVEKIEKLTGISGLVYGDVNLRGAGVHMIKNGGLLGMHTDFNTYNHPIHGKLDRRINLLLYMNKDWKSEYNGNLLMYHPDNISKVKSIEPIFNRCVIFNTSKKSVHGHPFPLTVDKEDMYRRSIAVYYYTKNENGKVDFEGDSPHSTLWHKVPNLTHNL